NPVWSPRGDLIAFMRGSSLFVVRPDGHGLRRLAEADVVGGGWSPDGKWLVFADGGSDSDHERLFIVGSDERGRRLVWDGFVPFLGGFAWSPDGHALAFGPNSLG